MGQGSGLNSKRKQLGAKRRKSALSDGVHTYLAAISDTVGARQQPQLSREQALYIAGCNAKHRDISLNF